MPILPYWEMQEISQTCVSTNGMTFATFLNKPKGLHSAEKLLDKYLDNKKVVVTRWHSGYSKQTLERYHS